MKNKEIEVIEKYLNGLISYPFQHKDKEYILSYIEQLENKNKENSLLLIEFQDMEQRIEQLENNRNKALKIIDSYELGKYDYSIPPGGIIELREVLKGDSDEQE